MMKIIKLNNTPILEVIISQLFLIVKPFLNIYILEIDKTEKRA